MFVEATTGVGIEKSNVSSAARLQVVASLLWLGVSLNIIAHFDCVMILQVSHVPLSGAVRLVVWMFLNFCLFCSLSCFWVLFCYCFCFPLVVPLPFCRCLLIFFARPLSVSSDVESSSFVLLLCVGELAGRLISQPFTFTTLSDFLCFLSSLSSAFEWKSANLS